MLATTSRTSRQTVTAPTLVARRDRADYLFDTLTLAFAADPAVRWMFPGTVQYARFFPAFARAFGGRAVEQGTAWAGRAGEGVALWLGPGVAPDENALGAVIADAVPLDRRDEVFAVFAEMERHHPGEPHWYLPLIGVDPAHQGRGLGSALLAPVLAQCDAEGRPAYLESTNPRNRPLYERHGFETVAEIRAGGCPPIAAMLRAPR